MTEQMTPSQVDEMNEIYRKTQEAAHRQLEDAADTASAEEGDIPQDNYHNAAEEARLVDEETAQFYEENKDTLHQIALEEKAKREAQDTQPQ